MWGKARPEVLQCSLVKRITVFLEPIPKEKIELLMGAFPHQEWLGYLVGEQQNGSIFVRDLVIPPQKASAGEAEAAPCTVPKDCSGIIHSHHTMGAFHSATDQAYADKNHPVSLTVSRKEGGLEYDAVSYTKTECGRGLTQKVTVKFVRPPSLFDGVAFLAEAKKNVGKLNVTHLAPVKDSAIYIANKEGLVMTEKELQEIMKDIYK